jgi:hypothetical protein
MNQLHLIETAGRWHPVVRCDPRARRLADRHYSRQTIGAVDFMPPGRKLVLLTDDARALWGVCENLDPAGTVRWRVTIFRNEGAGLSSELIEEATDRTVEFWKRHYGALPGVPLQTEVDPARTRHKRDPGRCFRKAGWTLIRTTEASHGRRSVLVFQANLQQALSA